MPNAPRTQHRSVRISDADWADLEARAPSSDRAATIKDLIAWYLRRPGAKLPDRPAAPAYITTDASDRYHSTAGCPLFQAGRKSGDGRHPIVGLTAADAVSARQTPCPECVSPIREES